MRTKLLMFCTVLVLITSCQHAVDSDEMDFFTKSEGLVGTWQIFEYGYSIGDNNYQTVQITDNPLPYIRMTSDYRFSSNYPSLDSFHYYQILVDDEDDSKILSLYEELPEIPSNEDIRKLRHSYRITLMDNHISLAYRFCREGCHIGIKKVLTVTEE